MPTSDEFEDRFKAAHDGTDDFDAQKWRSDVARRLFGAPQQEVMIGRHRVIERVGAGANGIVYAAYDPELDRKVALKLLRNESGQRQADSWLAREAKTLARLSHPNVVPVYDVGQHEGQVFITLEFVIGKTLREFFDAPHSVEETVEVFAQAGRGLAAAHESGLVHRDFKPENVLIGDDGRVRVSDFGIARHLDGPDQADTQPDCEELRTSGLDLKEPLTHAGAGTPAYMAPEQFLGDPIDARTDQFSFCVALHEAIYGRRPFAGVSRTQLAANVTAGRRIVPSIDDAPPAWLEALLERGLAAKPADRYATMAALLVDLTHDRKHHRVRILAIAAVGMATIAGGAAAFFALHDGPSPCDGAAAKLGTYWNDSTSTAIRDSFTRTDVPYARDTWLRVDASLTDYANEWSDAYTGACEADAPQTLVVERLHCLQSRLLEMHSLAEMFADADTTVVERAVPGVAGLRPPAECLFTEAAPEDEDEDHAEARREIRMAVARAKTLVEVGQPRKARPTAREAVRRARNISQRALEAEALLVQVRAELVLAGVEAGDSEQTAHAAILAAESAHRPDLVARAHALYVDAMYSQAQYEDALAWEPKARRSIAAVGAPPELVGRVEYVLALCHASLNQNDLAEKAVERSADALQRGGDRSRQWLVKAVNLGGELQFDKGLYEEAYAYYEQALDIAVDELGPTHPWAAAAHGNMAEVFFVTGRYKEAQEHFGIALLSRLEAFGDGSIWVVHSHAHMGDVALALGRPREALAHYEQGLSNRGRIRAVVGSEPAVYQDLQYVVQEQWLRNGRGAARVELGDIEGALEDTSTSAAPVEMPADLQHPDLTGRLDMRGYVLIAGNRYDEAIAQFELVLPRMREHYGHDHREIAWPLGGLGLALVALGEHERALPHLSQALAIRDRFPDAHPRHRADVAFAVAQALAKLRRDPDRALRLARQAHDDYQRAPNARRHDIEHVEDWLADNGD